MDVKILEIRDVGTFIPCMAAKMQSDHPQERYLLGRSGFGRNSHLVILMPLGNKNTWTYSPLDWADRTFETAHQYITDNWDQIDHGQVIDVEYILGESDKPKVSESEVTYP